MVRILMEVMATVEEGDEATMVVREELTVETDTEMGDQMGSELEALVSTGTSQASPSMLGSWGLVRGARFIISNPTAMAAEVAASW